MSFFSLFFRGFSIAFIYSINTRSSYLEDFFWLFLLSSVVVGTIPGLYTVVLYLKKIPVKILISKAVGVGILIVLVNALVYPFVECTRIDFRDLCGIVTPITALTWGGASIIIGFVISIFIIFILNLRIKMELKAKFD